MNSNAGENHKLRVSLAAQHEKIQNEIKIKRAELNSLARKGTVDVSKPILNANAIKNDGDPALEPTFSSVTRGQMEKLADEMMKTDLELFKVESELAAMELATQAETRKIQCGSQSSTRIKRNKGSGKSL